MYFSDFIKAPRPCRSYYLSGSNDYLKEFLIGIIANIHRSKVRRINSKQDLGMTTGKTLLGETYLWVVNSKLDMIPAGIAIKIGGAKIIEKYKKAGYINIVCNKLFPNQVEQLVAEYGKSIGVFPNNPPADFIKNICFFNEYDEVSCINTVKLIKMHGAVSIQELPFLCNNSSSVENSKLIDSILDSNYGEVVSAVERGTVDLSALCWSLLSTITKAIECKDITKPTWTQKRLQQLYRRLERYNISIILSYLYRLCSDYSLAKANRVYCFVYLLMYISGVFKITAGDISRVYVSN